MTPRHFLFGSSVFVLAAACVPEAPGDKTPFVPNPPPVAVRDAGFTQQSGRDAGTISNPIDSGVVKHDGGTVMEHDAGFRDGGVIPTGLPILGNGLHVVDAVTVTIVGTQADGHATPTDLAFNPQRPNELWVLNQADHSVWIVMNPGDSNQTADWVRDNATGGHFLAKPSGIAFGQPGTFATIHEEDEITQSTTPWDFMGPTLWSSNRQIFNAGHEGHLDMLHNTPNGMGIAWERDNIYWVFDGQNSAIARYDFHQNHGPGGTDHRDGEISRYAQGMVTRAPGIPSHLEYYPQTRQLFIADTGNNRIATLDVMSGSRGNTIRPNYDGCVMYRMDGASVQTWIDGASAGLVAPSGLEIHDGHVFVSDNDRSTISAFDLVDGELVDWIDTGLPRGSLMGMAFDDQGRLYFVDGLGNQVIRYEAQ